MILVSSVWEDSLYDLWMCVLPEGHDAVVRDLKTAYDVVIRWKDAGDISEKWFGVNSVESSVTGDSSGQQGVGFSNDVEVGEVEYLPESVPGLKIPSTSYIAKSPAEGKRRRNATPSPVVPNHRLEFDDESVVVPEGWGCTSMTPIFKLLQEIKTRLLHLGEVVVVVVLSPSSNPVLVNCIIILYFCICILVFRVFS